MIPEDSRLGPDTLLQAILCLGIDGKIAETESNPEKAAVLIERGRQLNFDWQPRPRRLQFDAHK